MANRFGNRILFILISSIVITCFLVFLFFYIKHQFTATRTEITETGMVQKITSMGKLELVKYTMKDIVEQKEIHPILPDSKVLFLAVGEVTACIDLTKVKKTDIIQGADSVTVFLPQPEICYAAIDHQKSRIYDISGTWFRDDTKNMVESVYKIAEKKIFDNAKQMDVLGTARQNAQLIFKPLLESISGKKVVLSFR
ncbi:DUF4230 domain-containing protein [Mucilaginibacter xinganensis]|uniref:DUF4230 domain-containing protein n=1 Tax=Mucilaginibacter xinganensis TaxID=1234841 RepID=A0A223NTQ1_9SPHI|nr:DUF4230 domain-containing protein [Mucilaginibacter xinganensis]ASU33262.1 hypothetical protein MuYL_1364 [Mucilaginibacter xinganensis]